VTATPEAPRQPGPTVRIAHVSDLHLRAPGALRAHHLFGKRILGALNLALGRRGAHPVALAEALVADLQAQGPDHVVITGDFSNLALAPEMERAAALVARLGGPERLSVLPGNHDRYTHGATRSRVFEQSFAPWLRSDLTGPGVGPDPAADGFPWVKRVGPVALIGLDSAVPTPWGFSSGRLGPGQLERLRVLLERPELEGLHPVVALHHPLYNRPHKATHRLRRLDDAPALLGVLARRAAVTVLHGHNHWVFDEQVQLGDGAGACRLDIRAATSATQRHGSVHTQARYAIHSFGVGGEVEVAWRRWDDAARVWAN